MEMNPVFVDRLKELGLDTSVYGRPPRKAVHILRNEEEVVEEYGLEKVPWAEHVYWVDDPRGIEKRYYTSVFVQDAASVVPVMALGVERGDVVVDLCAAPGSKTLHLSRLAERVVACDANRQRIKRLQHNLRRFRVGNCEVVCGDGRYLRYGEVDKVLVDAPCSGEGMVGKIHKVMGVWGLKRIKRLSHFQKQLVVHALRLVREGGVVVYSTCTFSPEENEEVVEYVLRKRDVEAEQGSIAGLKCIEGLSAWRGREYGEVLKRTIRVYPFHNGTNGFFVAKLRKGR